MAVPEPDGVKPESRDAGEPAGLQPPVPRNPPPSVEQEDRAIYYFALWIGIAAIVGWIILLALEASGGAGLLLFLLLIALVFSISFVAAAWLTKQVGVEGEHLSAGQGFLFVVLFALFVFCLLILLGAVCSTLGDGSL